MTDHDLLVSIHTQVERIVKLLDGNGKPGLIRDVAVLQDDMRRREQEAQDLREQVPQTKQEAKISARWNSGVIAVIVSGIILGVKQVLFGG